MIYCGVENGPAIGLAGFVTAWLATMLVIWATDLLLWAKSKQSLNRNL